MQFVDEEDDVLVATDFVHHGFDALFELAAVFGAGDLDRTTADTVLDLLRRLNRELHKTILMVTHDPQAAGYADKVIHLDKGKLGRIDDNRSSAGRQ